MTDRTSDAGSVPEIDERSLVPLIFEDSADDLVARVRQLSPSSVLEIAAWTAAVGRPRQR